jgi:hypothetical protein
VCPDYRINLCGVAGVHFGVGELPDLSAWLPDYIDEIERPEGWVGAPAWDQKINATRPQRVGAAAWERATADAWERSGEPAPRRKSPGPEHAVVRVYHCFLPGPNCPPYGSGEFCGGGSEPKWLWLLLILYNVITD